jgi:hypothetical protein
MVYSSVHAPQQELDAMISFYGGKRCVIQRMLTAVEWSYILDPSNEISERVSQYFIISSAMTPLKMRLLMLTHKLRQDRHPGHAAEVRENIVPRTSFCLSASVNF